MVRYFALFLFLAVTLALPFLFWGDRVEALFSGDGSLRILREYGPYAWIAGVALLIGDLVLPVPTTAVIAALGILYGPLLGGGIAAFGSFLSGLLGYGICRRYGRPLARWLMGEEALASGERLFEAAGGWLVAFSRWLPVLPEVVACLAGLSRMPLTPFCLALLCGVVPVGFVFAVAGHAGADRPVLTLVICALVPLLLWAIVRPALRRAARTDTAG